MWKDKINNVRIYSFKKCLWHACSVPGIVWFLRTQLWRKTWLVLWGIWFSQISLWQTGMWLQVPVLIWHIWSLILLVHQMMETKSHLKVTDTSNTLQNVASSKLLQLSHFHNSAREQYELLRWWNNGTNIYVWGFERSGSFRFFLLTFSVLYFSFNSSLPHLSFVC